ncbi:MAG: hypothetical protein Q8P67_19090, partial [archaeon]|nr:hypothetical protein [archaeon]
MISSPSNGEITTQLETRLMRDFIYTNIGEVLVSVNPYKQLPMFGEEHIAMYQNSSGGHDTPPHIYALAERAYKRLCALNESQSVIISGESGAGKTVAAKFILKFVTAVSPGSTLSGSSGHGGEWGASGKGFTGEWGASPPPMVPPRGGGPPRGAGGPPRGAPPRAAPRGGGPPIAPPRGGAPPQRARAPAPPMRGRGAASPAHDDSQVNYGGASQAPPMVAPRGGGPPRGAPPRARGGPPLPTRGASLASIPRQGGPRGGGGAGPSARGMPARSMSPPPSFGGSGGGGFGASSPSSSRGGAPNDVDYIKRVINESNPLMEAFGNAKTVRNDNSSRFGKYLEIQFDSSHAPVGGSISTFLLEKTRVAGQQKGERNYHIFYQMLAGLDSSLRSQFGLRDAQSYWYLSQSGCTSVDGVDDRQDFEEVVKAMRTVGFSDSEQNHIWCILSAILNLGNIRFEGEAPARVKDAGALQEASRLLAVEPDLLVMSLNHRQIQSGSARHTQFAVPQNAEQSAGIRDALSKELYSRVFDFIVAKINASLSASGSMNVIGVLDIYGFEIFDTNSFEQFCINYVNERLQQIFIDLTVRGEQKEYHDEGLKWKDIAFFDNKIVLELIEGRQPPGLFRLLDDTCRTVHSLETATVDAKFMEKLIKTHASHAHLYCPAQGSDAKQFTVKHYAGDVEYTVNEFSTKNNDNMYISLVTCMQGSNNPFIVSLFPEDLADDKRTPTTAGFKIRSSANYLVKRLSATTP